MADRGAGKEAAVAGGSGAECPVAEPAVVRGSEESAVGEAASAVTVAAVVAALAGVQKACWAAAHYHSQWA